MEIIDINVEKLKEYENNPRDNDNAVEYVAKSIKEFGFKVPIVVDKDNVIVAGHTRVKAAKFLKMETVPCIIADDLNEEQIRAFRLVDNKTSEFSKWDFDKLEEELKTINSDLLKYDFEIPEDINIDDFFEEQQEGNKEPKKIKCPECGHEFEV